MGRVSGMGSRYERGGAAAGAVGGYLVGIAVGGWAVATGATTGVVAGAALGAAFARRAGGLPVRAADPGRHQGARHAVGRPALALGVDEAIDAVPISAGAAAGGRAGEMVDGAPLVVDLSAAAPTEQHQPPRTAHNPSPISAPGAG